MAFLGHLYSLTSASILSSSEIMLSNILTAVTFYFIKEKKIGLKRIKMSYLKVLRYFDSTALIQFKLPAVFSPLFALQDFGKWQGLDKTNIS